MFTVCHKTSYLQFVRSFDPYYTIKRALELKLSAFDFSLIIFSIHENLSSINLNISLDKMIIEKDAFQVFGCVVQVRMGDQ